MTYFVRIKTSQGEPLDAFEITREDLTGCFVEPYREGGDITWDGQTVKGSTIKQLKIVEGSRAVAGVPLAQLRAQKGDRPVMGMVMREGKDVSNSFILGPWGYERPSGSAGEGVRPRLRGRVWTKIVAAATFIATLLGIAVAVKELFL